MLISLYQQKGVICLHNNYTKDEKESQELKILQKAQIKKKYNEKIIEWLRSIDEYEKAEKLSNCANYIGITEINGILKIVKADFCRERICQVCAWRRQAKFVSQTLPILEVMQKDYRFIFVTLTIKNVKYNKLRNAVDVLMKGYDRFLKRKKIKESFKGVIRSLELTYNAIKDEFHPHLHLLCAVDKDYYNNPKKYITQDELSCTWQEVCNRNYKPICHIESVENNERACIETIKYSLKPSKYNEALRAFLYILKGRRLVSFSGKFAKLRKTLFSPEEIETLNDIERKSINYRLYKFDVTGGVYKFYEEYRIKGE